MSAARTTLSIVCLIVCLFSVISFATVLSYPNFERASRPIAKSYCDQSWDLAMDIFLIFGALLFHYLLNCMDLFAELSVSTQRCLYSLFTALILQGVLFNWRRTSLFNLWTIEDVSTPVAYLIMIIHMMAYLQLIANSVFDDAIDAFGFRNWSDDTSEHSEFETTASYFNKSQELARLEGRLPSSGGLTLLSILFLLYPSMPLERALAALAFASYNFCTSTLEEQDYFYVKRHFYKKWNELLHFDKTATEVSSQIFQSGMSFMEPQVTTVTRTFSQESFFEEEQEGTLTRKRRTTAVRQEASVPERTTRTRRSTRT